MDYETLLCTDGRLQGTYIYLHMRNTIKSFDIQWKLIWATYKVWYKIRLIAIAHSHRKEQASYT
jgi:hypothetical protein